MICKIPSLGNFYIRPVCLVLFLAGLIPTAYAEDEVPTIRVTGSAELLVVPDEVVIDFSIQSRAKQVSEATRDNSTRSADVIAFAKKFGIDDKQVRTERLRIRPVFSKDDPRSKLQAAQDPFGGEDPFGGQEMPMQTEFEKLHRPIGYTIDHELSIKMEHPGSFEIIYPGLIERGVDKVHSIKFLSSQRKELEAKARILAIANARAKAEALVTELGARLAGVQSISDSIYDDDDGYMGPFGGRPETIATGQIKVGASIKVVFRMTETDFD